ncbi:hypothetical protein R6Q57_011477, partial [Mikania cordata]
LTYFMWFSNWILHPPVVFIYEYIYLWDKDLGVQHFNPKRYLDFVNTEGLEISQPTLDPNSTNMHYRIIIGKNTNKFGDLLIIILMAILLKNLTCNYNISQSLASLRFQDIIN